MLPEGCSKSIVDVLFRSIYVGGSTTLITRFALLSWISVAKTSKDDSFATKVGLLEDKLMATCDQQYVRSWQNGGISPSETSSDSDEQ